MKVCVISNSHLASLKKGADQLDESNIEVHLTFFGSPNRGIAQLRPNKEEGCLSSNNEKVREHLAQSSGGLSEISYADYDAFLIYGLFLTIPQLDQRLSSRVMRQTLDDTVDLSLAMRTVKKLHKLGSKPVFCSAEPLLSENRFDRGHKRPSSNVLPLNKTQALLKERIEDANTWFIEQPIGSIVDDFSTKAKYSKSSLRFDGGEHLARDIRHMNADYGQLYLETALNFIQEKAAT